MTRPLLLTSRGMVSSLGGVIGGCAAIRAGMTRPRTLAGQTVVRVADQAAVPATGHPVHGLTDGYPLTARWGRLAQAAFRDLLAQRSSPAKEDTAFWSRVGAVLVVPRLHHRRFQTEDLDDMQESQEAVIDLVMRTMVRFRAVEVIDAGYAGVIAALTRAREHIDSGSWSGALVIAVDSYLDDLSLEWLVTHGRLKADGIPCGLAPGEAGVCLLVEPLNEASARNARPSATIEALVHLPAGVKDPDVLERAGLMGRAFMAAWNGDRTPFSGMLVADLNGEEQRARVFAMGIQHVHAGGRLAPHHLLMPAASLGDTGAAAGGIGICLSTHHFLRVATIPPMAGIISQGEDGDIGVAIMSRVA